MARRGARASTPARGKRACCRWTSAPF